MKKSTVRVYDTISKEYVDIEVGEEVYTYYNRSQWNMDDNDDSFYSVTFTAPSPISALPPSVFSVNWRQ